MTTDALLNAPARQRVLVLGATGTIGQAAVKSLLREGHEVVCFIRAKAGVNGKLTLQDWQAKLPGAVFRTGDVTDLNSLTQDGFAGEQFDTLMSCLASRTGNPKDAWAIDHAAHMVALNVAQALGVKHFVLLSAICVQKPLLTFQHAKLAFEDALVKSGMRYAIVRPTAFFKSLCGQIERVRKGKPFLLFGNGQLTACKQQAQVVVNFGHGAYGGARVVAGGFLFDGNGGRQALNQIHVGLVHQLQKLTSISRQTFDIAALTLGIQGVKRQARFARTAEASDHHQLVAGNIEVDVLKVVRAGPAHADVRLAQGAGQIGTFCRVFVCHEARLVPCCCQSGF